MDFPLNCARARTHTDTQFSSSIFFFRRGGAVFPPPPCIYASGPQPYEIVHRDRKQCSWATANIGRRNEHFLKMSASLLPSVAIQYHPQRNPSAPLHYGVQAFVSNVMLIKWVWESLKGRCESKSPFSVDPVISYSFSQ